MPAKQLTVEQKAEADALKARFKAHQQSLKAAGQPWTQYELADQLPFGQSALAQYLGGKIPLNADAVLAFSRLLGVPPADISPLIDANERGRSSAWGRAEPAGANTKMVRGNNFLQAPEEERTKPALTADRFKTGSKAELPAMLQYLRETLEAIDPGERLKLIDYARMLRGDRMPKVRKKKGAKVVPHERPKRGRKAA